MQEEIDGYRRTSVKTRHKHILKQKLEQFQANGEETKVYESGGYSYIYVKKEKNLNGSKEENKEG